jgi:pimeloyl-ACP methyl ester carboxylesterase
MGKITKSEETIVEVNGVELCYDTFGDPQNPAMLLVMGLASQMIRWQDQFCEQLASNGYFVIRFDNRDIGRSTKFEEAGVPNMISLIVERQQGKDVSAPYTMTDMAKDAMGLLDALKIKAAHVVGVSMGGMIAQTMAIKYPERVQTLTSIMSTTGNPDLPLAKNEVLSLFAKQAPTDRDEYIEYFVKRQEILSGPHYPPDEANVRDLAGRSFDRSFYPQGTARQLAAVLASGSRKEALNNVQTPTLVIHGDADPLVPVEGGKDTAVSIPGAQLAIITGMGHDIPPKLAPKIIQLISQHAK